MKIKSKSIHIYQGNGCYCFDVKINGYYYSDGGGFATMEEAMKEANDSIYEEFIKNDWRPSWWQKFINL